ncbi:hypothetical protein LTR04_003295, partial [Oleoguttula sp. CCFEE 6159]
MEDLQPADDDYPVPTPPLPEAGSDPDDPLRPEVDEENSTPNPPISAPTQDMEVTEEKEEIADEDEAGVIEDDSDAESDVLSEVDEAQFEDFDPANIAIEERPVVVDETNVGLLGVHKRKRDAEGDGERKKKRKEGRREKPKKSRKKRDEEDSFSGGEELEGKRARKRGGAEGGDRRKERKARRGSPENEEDLTPEQRRARALDRAMDEAVRNPNKRRRKQDGIDLDAMADAEIEEMRRRMTEAAQADTDARANNRPAMHKLKMLPEVVALLNRNTLTNSLVDLDINLLEAVRFFLEPLNDGSLPAYNIQRDLFGCLSRLPITKDALIASGVGKVTLFYTKSKRPEQAIKRQAEKLLGEWTRPILKRSDDYRKREFVEANYDPNAPTSRAHHPTTATSRAALARAAALAPPALTNRARVDGTTQSYTIVPRNNLAAQQDPLAGARRMGASGEDAFRKMKARGMGGG